MATKADLANVARAILKNQEDLQELKKSTATKDDVNLILNRIDAFAGKSEVLERKYDVHDHRLNDHEERLTVLEKSK